MDFIHHLFLLSPVQITDICLPIRLAVDPFIKLLHLFIIISSELCHAYETTRSQDVQAAHALYVVRYTFGISQFVANQIENCKTQIEFSKLKMRQHLIYGIGVSLFALSSPFVVTLGDLTGRSHPKVIHLKWFDRDEDQRWPYEIAIANQIPHAA